MNATSPSQPQPLGPPVPLLIRTNSGRSQTASTSHTMNLDRSPGISIRDLHADGVESFGKRPVEGSTRYNQDEGLEMLSAPQPIRLNSEEILGGGTRSGNGVEGGAVRRDRRISLNSRLGPSPPPPPGPPPSEPPPLPPPPTSSSGRVRRSSVASSIQSTNSNPSQSQSQVGVRRTPSVQSGMIARTTDQELILGPPVMSMGTRQVVGHSHNTGGELGRGTAEYSAQPQIAQRAVPRKSSVNALHAMAGAQTLGQPSGSADVFGTNAQPIIPSHRSRTSNATSLASNQSTSSNKTPRIPSKQLLQLALDMAQKAVELDRANDVDGALSMYREAVGKLRAVMERVGIEVGPVPPGLGLPNLTENEKEEAEHARRKRQANGSARPEDEGRTLRGIHDAYIARIGLLIVMQAAQKSPTSSDFHSRQSSDAFSHTSHNPSSSTGSMSAIGNLMLSGLADNADDSNTSTPVKYNAPYTDASGKGKGVDRPVTQIVVDGVFHPYRQPVRNDSVHAGVDALYPPPISSPPRPRPRVASLQNRDVDLANMQTPLLSGPDINIVAGTPNWGSMDATTPTVTTVRGQPIVHGRSSSVNHFHDHDGEAAMASDPNGLPSARSDTSLGSSKSGRRRSAREGMKRTSSNGLHQELGVPEGEGEDQEVLAQTPTGQTIGEPFAITPSPRSAKFDGIQALRRDPSDAPLISPRAASLGSLAPPASDSSSPKPVLISASTAAGSIIQRRRNGGDKQMSISSVIEEDETSYDVIRTGESGADTPPLLPIKAPSDGAHTFSLKSASFLGDWSKDISKLKSEASLPARLRTRSQPGKRPSISKTFDPGEPMPPLPHQMPLSPSGASGKYTVDLGGLRGLSSTLSPGSDSATLTLPSPRKSPSLPSPLPEAPPSNPLHRPYHLMRLITRSIRSSNGGFLSDRLHVPRAMWIQTTVKVPGLETKVRVVDLLTANVLNVARIGDSLLQSPEEAQLGSRTPARDFAIALEEFEGLMDEIQKMLSKKLGLTNVKNKGGIGGFGSKFAKTLDKMTNGKNVESPTVYVESLSRLCQEAQALDRHNHCISDSSHTLYDTLTWEAKNAIEGRLRRISDFFSQVLLAFVFQDIGLMLSKYLKHSTRWIED